MAVPTITIFVRHSTDCPNKDEFWKKCNCRKHLRWFHNGKLYRQSAKTRSWAQAEAERRKLEARFEAANGAPVKPEQQTWKTVALAIDLFLDAKRSEGLSPDTVYRHEQITKLLLDFCNREGILFIKDLTLAHLTTWQAQWTLKAPQARRSRQEKVKNFLKYCLASGMVLTNPAVNWKSVKVKFVDQNVRALEQQEYDKILSSIEKTKMTDVNKARIRALMQLQRWAGLSLVDAVCLSKDELVRSGDVFRVVRGRQKTGTRVNNVIPTWLGEELLTVKNGNPRFFFWSGETTAEDAPSYFQKLYRKVFKKAGIEESSHAFRHTYAIGLLTSGVDIRTVSKALGHSSIQVTEKFYSKWCKGQQSAMDETLTKALIPSKPPA